MSEDETLIAQQTSRYNSISLQQNIEHDEDSLSTKIGSLLLASQDSIDSAQGVIDGVVAEEIVKSVKFQVKALLEPLQPVLSLLDAVSQFHPATAAAIGAFKVVIQLHFDRVSNDRKIAAMFFQIMDLMTQLGYLDPVFKQDDGLTAMLQKNMESISQNINDFGNFCDLYYKHKSFVRTILSARYKAKLADSATIFSNEKDKLVFLLQQRVAIDVANTNDKLDKLYVLIESQTSEERRTNDIVELHGGLEEVLSNNQALTKVASAVGDQLTSSMRMTLRMDLDVMLEANVELYNLKIDAAVEKISEAMERSTATILLRLDAGPHELIQDEDIREIWKLNNWRMTCKLRAFCETVHYHFRYKFALHLRETGEPHPDSWTLDILSRVVYHSAIGDAIDDDGSGYLSVTEVNHFFKYKPKGWSSPELIAFWAIGWYKNQISYTQECSKALEALKIACAKVREENYTCVKDTYFNNVIEDLDLIVNSIYVDNLSVLGQTGLVLHPRLQTIRHHYMEEELARLQSRLAKANYRIDDIQEVYGVCGSHRVEHTILPFLYFVLKRHCAVMELAETKVLQEEEFHIMSSTIDCLTSAFDVRLKFLSECWRQQRLDVKIQVKSYAAGLFEPWYLWEEDGEESDSSSEEEEEGDEEDEEDDDIPWDGEDDSVFFRKGPKQRSISSLCNFPIPDQPSELARPYDAAEEEMENTTRTQSTQVSNKRLQKRLFKVESRLEAMDSRLDDINKTLEKILAATTSGPGTPMDQNKDSVEASGEEPAGDNGEEVD